MSHLVGPDVSAPARCRRDVGRNILRDAKASRRQGDLFVWNADFGQVALDYRFAPALCWPRAAQQKGAVEQLVGRGKRSFFTCRRFHDRADLERQLAAWLVDVKTMRPSRATGVIPAVRLADGRGRHIELRGRSYRTRHAPLDLTPARSHATRTDGQVDLSPRSAMRAMRLVTNSRLAGDVLCHRDGAFSHQCAASVWAADAVACSAARGVRRSASESAVK